MGDLIRRARCHLGWHDVIRCAGREDHTWTWVGTRWVATIHPPVRRPAPRGHGYRPTGQPQPEPTTPPAGPAGTHRSARHRPRT